MCIYSKLITNPKYKPNKKNGGVPPFITDLRVAAVPIACGECIECRKAKANQWKIRLQEDIKVNTNGKFVTFTFSNESLEEITAKLPNSLEGYDLQNAIAKHAVDKFCERWRYKTGKTMRHWLVTELGQNNTERIHLHGIIWTDEPKRDVLAAWQYGNMGYDSTWKEERNYVDGSSISYITKYVNKLDAKHPGFKSIILTSNGMGNNYTKTKKSKDNRFREEDTIDQYRQENGTKIQLPTYYRDKLYTDDEKEKLWIHKLNKQIRYVNGVKIDISKSYEKYFAAIRQAQIENKALGYGAGKTMWKETVYKDSLKQLYIKKREEEEE